MCGSSFRPPPEAGPVDLEPWLAKLAPNRLASQALPSPDASALSTWLLAWDESLLEPPGVETASESCLPKSAALELLGGEPICVNLEAPRLAEGLWTLGESLLLASWNRRW